MKTRDLRKVLRALGCTVTGTEGSHEKWQAPHGHTVTLKAATKDQAPGTLRNIQGVLEVEFGPRWLELRQ